jgi:hypothetical protein
MGQECNIYACYLVKPISSQKDLSLQANFLSGYIYSEYFAFSFVFENFLIKDILCYDNSQSFFVPL